MSIKRLASVLLVFLVLATGLSGCAIGPTSTTSKGKVPETAACPEMDWEKLSLSWKPAISSPTGFREVCLDETSALTVELESTDAQLPVTVTGADGVDVRVSSTERVLALDISGSLASTVVALGAADQLVGRDTATSEKQLQKLPAVTSESHTLNTESILAVKPDLVITDGTLGPRRVLEQLRDLGIAVVMVDSSRGLSHDSSRIELVASALGLKESGLELSSQVNDAVELVHSRIELAVSAEGLTRPRVAFLYLRGSAQVYFLLGQDSGISDLVEAAGGIDVAREQGITDSIPLTSEALLEIQPDVILTMTSGLESVGGVSGLLELLPQLSGVEALARGNVIVVPDEYVLRFVTYSPATVFALAQALFGTS